MNSAVVGNALHTLWQNVMRPFRERHFMAAREGSQLDCLEFC
ncbi:MAG: hypothetical protein ACYTG0_45775 [Planctomycetota bacterium]